MTDSLKAIFQTAGLLIASNIFMTFAWYAHLNDKFGLKNKTWLVAALVSWFIALFEYLLQVPANRLGHNAGLELGQLKVMQEVITLLVFVPFAVLFMGEKMRLDYLWAGLCLVGAVYFVFRHKIHGGAAAH
jgi:uncharacterized protein (DUF486 family)